MTNSDLIKSRPTVLVFSDPHGLAVSTVEVLLSNFCSISVVSDNEQWTPALKHLSENSNVRIISPAELSSGQKFDYALCFSIRSEHSNGNFFEKERERIENALKTSSLETLFISNYQLENSDEQEIVELLKSKLKDNNGNIGLVYVGDLLGKRAPLSNNRVVGSLVISALKGEDFLVQDRQQKVFPTDLNEVSRELVRLLFSFGGTGEEVSIIGKPVLVNDFIKTLSTESPVRYLAKGGFGPRLVNGTRFVYAKTQLREALSNTLEWYKESFPKDVKKDRTFKAPEAKQAKLKAPTAVKSFLARERKGWARKMLLAILVLTTPYVFAVVGLFCLYLSKTLLLNSSFKAAELSIKSSEWSLGFSEKQLFYLSRTPIVSIGYKEGFKFVQTLHKTSSIAKNVLSKKDLVEEYLANVFSEKSYQHSTYQDEIYLFTSELFEDLAFLEGEIKDSSVLTKTVFGSIFQEVSLKEIRSKVLVATEVVKNLDWIFGAEEKRRYLILIQDSTELRATGGRIKAIGFLDFEDGLFVNIAFQSVESADSLLSGTVVPPTTLKKYLGKNAWILSDSNWDPDFPTSAQKAEWFIDKEIGESVNGVIAIDIEGLRELLPEDGIKTKLFETPVTQENYYDLYFGSLEASNSQQFDYLEAILGETFEHWKDKDEKTSDLAGNLYQLFSAKHLQVFVHNNDLQNQLSKLNWDGALVAGQCLDNCYADHLSVVFSNVSENNVDFFVERTSNLWIDINEGGIERILTLEIENTSNLQPAGGEVGESYVRVYAPLKSNFKDVEVVRNEISELVNLDVSETRGVKEAGVGVTINPGEKTTLIFRWNSEDILDLTRQGEYFLNLRKQAGTKNDAAAFNITVNSASYPSFDKLFVLTEDGSYFYNTYLTRDFSSRVFW